METLQNKTAKIQFRRDLSHKKEDGWGTNFVAVVDVDEQYLLFEPESRFCIIDSLGKEQIKVDGVSFIPVEVKPVGPDDKTIEQPSNTVPITKYRGFFHCVVTPAP